MDNERLKFDLTTYQDATDTAERARRMLWMIVWALFARPIPRNMLAGWKRCLLRLFGAKIHPTAAVYGSAHIYAPWNLEMGEHSTIGPGVDCYNADRVIIGAHVVVSQKASLYTASHRTDSARFEWFSAPVVIEDQAWVAAESFIMAGVTIGRGAVVGARAAVFKNVEPWTIVGGNPARVIKKRTISRE